MNPSLRLGLRVTLACVTLLVLAQLYGTLLVEKALPLYRWEIGLLENRYEILDLKLDKEGADQVIRLVVTLDKPVFIGMNYLMPDERGHANASTMTGNTLQPLVLMLALILAWPFRHAREMGARWLAIIPLGTAVLMLDVPFVLVGSLWGIILEHLAPGDFSALLLWNDFLLGGGRWALGIAAGLLAIAWGSRFRQNEKAA